MTLRCVLSTNNPDKAAEIQAILEELGDVELLDRPRDGRGDRGDRRDAATTTPGSRPWP